MRPRWYEQDDNGSSTAPDAADYYYYRSDNRLDKAIYHVTRDGNDNPIDLAAAASSHGAIDDNDSTHSDRVIYSRRHVGTRDRVNWYRGSADPGDSPPGAFDEDSNAPTQKTHYETSDDPGADPDNPAADGEGSRNNCTEIGNVGSTYDNNRNLQADGTREFRYNYRNQLRKVWRKSDGDSDGLVSQYREDAFGRRVLTHSWWELARRVYLDTRFELDIDMDADGNSTDMEYLNGGITSTSSTEQRADFESRIYRTHATLESHYYDFLVKVPDVGGSNVYLGMVGVVSTGVPSFDYELRIYGDRYELHGNGQHIGTATVPGGTGGWHNIGLRAGVNADTWIDGWKSNMGGVPLGINAKVKFSTLQSGTGPGGEDLPGIELYECLTYLRSYNRSQVEHSQPPGGGHLGGEGGYSDDIYDPTQTVVDVTYYDNVQPVTKVEIIQYREDSAFEALMSDVEGDPTRVRYHFAEGGSHTDIRLPNARRGTGLVVRDNADLMVHDEVTGTLTPNEVLMPGVAIRLHHGADGAVDAHVRTNPACASGPDPRESQNADHTRASHDLLKCTSTYFGSAVPPSDTPSSTTADPMNYVGEDITIDVDQQGPGAMLFGEGSCACNADDPSKPNNACATVDPSIGMTHDYMLGNANDYPMGIPICFGFGIPLLDDLVDEVARRGEDLLKKGGEILDDALNKGKEALEKANEVVKEATGVDPLAEARELADKAAHVQAVISLLNNIRGKVWGKYWDDAAAIAERMWSVVTNPVGTWKQDVESIIKFFNMLSGIIDAYQSNPCGFLEDLVDYADEEFTKFIKALVSDDEEEKAEAWAEVLKLIGDIALAVGTAGATTGAAAAGAAAKTAQVAKNATAGSKKAGGIYKAGVLLLEKLSGQLHHVLSKRIRQSMARHKNLKNMKLTRKRGPVTQAADKKSHCGYKGWHEDVYDKDIVDWINDNPDASVDDFKGYLKKYYDTPDMKRRFPNGIDWEE